MAKNGRVIATTSQCAQPFCLPWHPAFLPCELALTIVSSIISTSRSSRAVTLLFVNARNSVHQPPFGAGLAPSLCSCLFPQPVGTPAHLNLTIHYLSRSSFSHVSLAPSAFAPSFVLLPHPASSSLASPYFHALYTHYLNFFVTPLQPLHPVALLGYHHNRLACEHQPQPGEGSVFKQSHPYLTRRHAEETSPYLVHRVEYTSIPFATTNASHTCYRAPQLVRSFHTHELQHKCCSRITTRRGEDGKGRNLNTSKTRPSQSTDHQSKTQDPRRSSPLGKVFRQSPTVQSPLHVCQSLVPSVTDYQPRVCSRS